VSRPGSLPSERAVCGVLIQKVVQIGAWLFFLH
jgi:hypothetical protein